jgi:phosphate uptake regulator
MTDHVARMVNGWLDAQRGRHPDGTETRSVASLVDAIHRMIREAEDETRRRCEEVAQRAATSEEAHKVALAIRSLRKRA